MKVAIYTDEIKAERIINVCQKARETAQNIHDELIKTGCTFTIPEIMNLWQLQANEEQIKQLIFDKKMEAEPPVIFGLKLSKHKLLSLVEVENIRQICDTYTGVQYSNADNIHAGYATEYLTINGGVVELSADYQQEIKDKYCTLYATSEAQKAKADKLVNIATALNELDGILRENWRGMVEIEGIKEVNKKFVPDMKAIGYLIQ